MRAAIELLDGLRERAAGRKRIRLAAVWQIFRRDIRGYTGDLNARPQLAALLNELEALGTLRQPKSKSRWDHVVDPPLPHWVELSVPDQHQPQPQPHNHRTIAWPATMRFVSELPRVRNLEELLAIRRFLAAGGTNRPLVPIRERSLDLFGDEKRLDKLRKGALFRPGRLSLDLLRCHEVAPPLTWQPGPATNSRTVLILENLHSYDSFRRFNRQKGQYRAIAYGHGSELHATIRDVPRLLADLDAQRVEYFGDLDAKGLEIAYAAHTWLCSCDLTLSPATHWYQRLIDKALQRKLEGAPQVPSAHAMRWLPPTLRDRVTELLTAGYRAPQELVGWETLEQL